MIQYVLCPSKGKIEGFSRAPPAYSVVARTGWLRRGTTQQPRASAIGVPATPAVEDDEASEGKEKAQPGSPAPATPEPSVVAPPQLFDKAVAAGVRKANQTWGTTFLLGFLGGCYIGFGALLALTCGGNCPGIAAANPGLQKFFFGAIGLPFGMIMCILSGAEVFTGNTAILAMAILAKRAKMSDLVKNWVASYAGNLVGTAFLVCSVAVAGILAGNPAPVEIATTKANLPIAQAFARGLLCNWLVGMAVYQATAANDVIGKFIGVFIPVCIFVTTGLENSVANMFIIPMGMALGAAVQWSDLVYNLVVVSLGNIVGGAFCMGYSKALVNGGGRLEDDM